MLTIVELSPFHKNAANYLTDGELEIFKDHISRNPVEGAVIQGTGGIRKMRWAVKGKGKSGGVRVIYYFYNVSIPLFLITIYGKSDKSSLSPSERNAMKQLTALLKRYGD